MVDVEYRYQSTVVVAEGEEIRRSRRRRRMRRRRERVWAPQWVIADNSGQKK
jgi:hypothetical protein